jgi:tetratricopeptide (TPR) repeat protein
MAIGKKHTKKEPTPDPVNLDLANIYLKMGLREEALAQYRGLLRQYKALGMNDKALKVMALIDKISPGKTVFEKKKRGLRIKDGATGIFGPEKPGIPEDALPQKRTEAYFDLGAELVRLEPDGAKEYKEYKEIELLEKEGGFGEIIKELRELGAPGSLNFNFNYHMGVACRERGLIGEAIAQFQIAYEEGQNRFEAAHLLGLCFREKGMWEEARRAFERALQVDGVSSGNQLAVKCELGLILKEQGKTEEALELLWEISGSDQKVQDTKDKSNSRKKKSSKV